MRKLFFSAAMFILSTGCALSQAVANWFDPRSTQIGVLTAQIEAYKAYLSDAEQGYGIARQGLALIGQWKRDEFDLHGGYFSSLQMVNPAIAGDPRVRSIIACDLAIIRNLKKITSIHRLTGSEISYLRTLCSNMSISCNHSIGELTRILTDSTYVMGDEARLRRIGFIYEDARSKYAFSLNFVSAAHLLSLSRTREMNDIHMSEINNNLK